MSNQYEVLTPWAEADPRPGHGINPRVTDLTGKKVGLFINYKRAAPLILAAVGDKLKQRFPTITLSEFVFGQNYDVGESEEQGRFEEWLKGVDTVVAAVGD